jgi:hypothetical protein
MGIDLKQQFSGAQKEILEFTISFNCDGTNGTTFGAKGDWIKCGIDG